MTDLALKPGADEAHPDAAASGDPQGDAPTSPTAETAALAPTSESDATAGAPAEPAPKKRRTGVWIGAGAGTLAVALVASSLILIAPGTSVAGVPVGWLTAGAATDAVNARLAETTVVLTGAGGDVEVNALDLGASVDARALADTAFASSPMWNVTQWFPEPIEASVSVDPALATAALRAAAPDLYTDPVDATLVFDAEAVAYVTTPDVDGTGIDVEALRAALNTAFAEGETNVAFDPVTASIPAETPAYVADAAAANLNGILDTAGFYVGDERTVVIPREQIASWLTVTPTDRGSFEISADEAAIQAVVETLPAAVNREAARATVITDTSGGVLSEITAGVVGRELGDTSGIAAAYAEQIASGQGAYTLPVTEVPFETTALARNIVVDLSDLRTYLYENGTLVNSYAISAGKAGSPTFQGSFRINWKRNIQDMGCFEGAPYCTKDVPWVAYFNGDQAFHGAYWHNNFGAAHVSSGCVNMPVAAAKFLYDWAPVGTEVQVRA